MASNSWFCLGSPSAGTANRCVPTCPATTPTFTEKFFFPPELRSSFPKGLTLERAKQECLRLLNLKGQTYWPRTTARFVHRFLGKTRLKRKPVTRTTIVYSCFSNCQLLQIDLVSRRIVIIILKWWRSAIPYLPPNSSKSLKPSTMNFSETHR